MVAYENLKKKKKNKTVIKNVTVSAEGMMAYAVALALAVAVAAQTGWLYVMLEHFYIATKLLYSLRVYF